MLTADPPASADAEFSTTYAEATAKFRAAAARRSLPVVSWRNPQAGPNGEPLETLVTEIGAPDARNVMVINTGVHGTEALAGAAILTGLLDDADDVLRDLTDFKVVLVHILNPYGAAWFRYVNEDNVDLMKNLAYGDRPTPEDPLFMAFDDAMDLARMREPDAPTRLRAVRERFLATHGLDRLMESLKKGQSDRPKSICYNGRGATWSTRTLDEILRTYAGGARQVFFVDLHTGVGSYGEAYVIAAGPAESQARLRALLGEAAHSSDLVVPEPCYTAQARTLPDACFTAATVEAGTVDFDDGFREAMWLEMHDHMHGSPTSSAAWDTKRRFRAYYYPDDPAWRATWRRNCRSVLRQFLEGMSQWRAVSAL
jgi:hypothetical protein